MKISCQSKQIFEVTVGPKGPPSGPNFRLDFEAQIFGTIWPKFLGGINQKSGFIFILEI